LLQGLLDPGDAENIGYGANGLGCRPTYPRLAAFPKAVFSDAIHELRTVGIVGG
jgi:hypothetical protein